jgi:hypothetical protein
VNSKTRAIDTPVKKLRSLFKIQIIRIYMSNLSFFEFRSNRVRTVVVDGEVAFCLGDALAAMGIMNDIEGLRILTADKSARVAFPPRVETTGLPSSRLFSV